MRKLGMLCSVLLLILGCMIPVCAEEEDTTQEPVEENTWNLLSSAYILMDNNSGSVLYEGNSEESYWFSSLPYLLTIAGLNGDAGTINGWDSSRWSQDTALSITDLNWLLFFTQDNSVYDVLAQRGTDLSQIASNYEMMSTNLDEMTTTARNVALLARKFTLNKDLREMYYRSVYTPSSFVDNSDLWREALELEGLIGYYIQNDGRVGFASFEVNGARFSAAVMEEESVENCRQDLQTIVAYAKTHYKGLTIEKSSVEEKTIIVEDETQIATISFTLNSDISILLGIDVDESSLLSSVVVENEDSIDESEGYLVITRNGNEIGRIVMVKRVQSEEKEVTSLPLFDLLCMGLAGIVVVVFVLKHGMNLMRPV